MSTYDPESDPVLLRVGRAYVSAKEIVRALRRAYEAGREDARAEYSREAPAPQYVGKGAGIEAPIGWTADGVPVYRTRAEAQAADVPPPFVKPAPGGERENVDVQTIDRGYSNDRSYTCASRARYSRGKCVACGRDWYGSGLRNEPDEACPSFAGARE